MTNTTKKASLNKAVFPAAGLGTRFLPATKAMPKEMLPVVDKPLIQYAVEETKKSGISDICIVTGRGKTAIEDHFDESFELEHVLRDKGKTALLEKVQSISDIVTVAYVRQKEALGLGHAVLVAKNHVGRNPFAVVLADDVIKSKTPCLKQLKDVFEKTGDPVLALMKVPSKEISAYGVVAATPETGFGNNKVFRIHDLVEKPEPSQAPSNLAIIGRYILTPDIFECLESLGTGAGGEIQLTDGLRSLLKKRPIYGVQFSGSRFDAGDKMGFLKANVEFALGRRDFGKAFSEYLDRLQKRRHS